MKQTLIYLCLNFLSIPAFAQFDYSIDFVSGIDQSNLEGFLQTFDSPNYTQRIGVNFNVKLFDNVRMKSGLRFAEIGTQSFGPVIALNNRRYIEIPLILRYQIGERAISGFFEFGFSPHIYRNTHTRISSNRKIESCVKDESSNGVKKYRRAMVFGIGVNYNVRDNVQLFFQFVTRNYTSHEIQASSSIGFKNIGFELGVRRGFSFEKDD